MRTILTLLTLSLGVTMTHAAGQTVEYEFEGTKLKGYLAVPKDAKGKLPGILVVHEWWGLNDYAKKRADMLAELGYVAFCVDMYGDGKTTEHPKEAGEMATAVRSNIKVWQGRALAGLKKLASHENVDSTKLAAIGYCFGGSTALKLAYTGANLKAVATFHAALPTPSETEAQAIKARVLVCHGAEDKFIAEKDIKAFQDALQKAKVQLQFESYPGAVHSFTVKGIDEKKISGLAYNEEADKKSWEAMQKLFQEVFATK